MAKSTNVVVVKGGAELEKELLSMAERLRRKYLRQAAAAGGRVIINAAKANLRARGTRGKRVDKNGKRIQGLAMSMKLRPTSQWPSRAKLARQGIVGTSIGFEWPVGAHAHLVEFGHRLMRRVNSNPKLMGWRQEGTRFVLASRGQLKQIGIVPPRPFFRPAVESTKSQVLSVFRQKLSEGLQKEARESLGRIRSHAGG